MLAGMKEKKNVYRIETRAGINRINATKITKGCVMRVLITKTNTA